MGLLWEVFGFCSEYSINRFSHCEFQCALRLFMYAESILEIGFGFCGSFLLVICRSPFLVSVCIVSVHVSSFHFGGDLSILLLDLSISLSGFDVHCVCLHVFSGGNLQNEPSNCRYSITMYI